LSAAGTRFRFSKSRTVPSLTPALAPSRACGQSRRSRAARHCSDVSRGSDVSWVTGLSGRDGLGALAP
jgi:hypothetical protein